MAGYGISTGFSVKYTPWGGVGDGGAAIVNSNESIYRALMIIGSGQSTGFGRVVKVWDSLQVQGSFLSTGRFHSVGTTDLVSNLNADLLDGINSTSFLRSDSSATNTVDIRTPILYDSNNTGF